MSPFLLDANISPETAAFLQELGFDASALITRGLGHLTDPEVVRLAKDEGRILITFDLDFGEIYFRTQRGQLGVIILRLSDQTTSAVHRVLAAFFETVAPSIELEASLV